MKNEGIENLNSVGQFQLFYDVVQIRINILAVVDGTIISLASKSSTAHQEYSNLSYFCKLSLIPEICATRPMLVGKWEDKR